MGMYATATVTEGVADNSHLCHFSHRGRTQTVLLDSLSSQDWPPGTDWVRDVCRGYATTCSPPGLRVTNEL